jgi:V8-like Glu-specific endopeptidase
LASKALAPGDDAMGTTKSIWSKALAAFLTALALVGAATGEATAASPTSIYVHESPGRARDYWTPARMRSAEAEPGMRRQGAHGLNRSGVPAIGGAPQLVPPRAPAGVAGASSAGSPVADPTAAGLSVNGAVFIVADHGFLRGRCSATSVNAPNLSVVITAGHCVHEFGHWFDEQWAFVPGYRYGQRPFGVFPAKWLGSTPQWLARENENYDVGAAVVSRNERGERLAEAVGADGIAWGLSPDQTFDLYGYPVEEPFDGSTLQVCPQTRFEGHDFLSFLEPGPLDVGVECDFTAGSSGGGWVIDGHMLNGVTSSGYADDPRTEFGPYFGKAVGRLFHEAARVR